MLKLLIGGIMEAILSQKIERLRESAAELLKPWEVTRDRTLRDNVPIL